MLVLLFVICVMTVMAFSEDKNIHMLSNNCDTTRTQKENCGNCLLVNDWILYF